MSSDKVTRRSRICAHAVDRQTYLNDERCDRCGIINYLKTQVLRLKLVNEKPDRTEWDTDFVSK